MTHYEIDYSSMKEPEKHEQALKDIVRWLGSQERFDELTKAFREDQSMKKAYRRFSTFAAFAGVRGYPTVAWHNHCYGFAPGTADDEEV